MNPTGQRSGVGLNDPIPQHQRVAVFGLGASGRAACRLLTALGKSVVACDSRTGLSCDDLPDSVIVVQGRLSLEGATTVVLSPSLNPDWPENAAKNELAPVYAAWRDGSLDLWSEVELGMCAFAGNIVTVGGTDGKSTTAALCAHLARASGVDVLLGGNSWTAFSDVLLQNPAADLAVVEVSAFQSWAGHRMKPDAAILTNIAADHLDHYADEADYVEAKRLITANLGIGSAVVLWSGDRRLASWVDELEARGVCVVGYDGATPAPPPGVTGTPPAWDDALRVPGAHNRRNAAAAFEALRAVGVWKSETHEAMWSSLQSFGGLPHRIQFVRELDGVWWYNDSKATNVHAACVGLRAIDRPLVAIVGGVDKGLDLVPLIETLRNRAHDVLVIGELRERFCAEADGALTTHPVETLEEAITLARRLANDGDAVTLAPASSSFDMFASFGDRGDQFAAGVQALR